MPLKASGLRKAASNAIKASGGTDVIMRRVTTAAYNTTTGAAAESVSDTTVKAIVSDVSAREVGDLVRSDDRQALIAASSLTVAPTTEDRVVIDSVVYQVISVSSTEVSGSAVTYQLVLRS